MGPGLHAGRLHQLGQAPWHIAGGDDSLLLLGEPANDMVSDHVPLRHTVDMVSDPVLVTDHVPLRNTTDMVSDQAARPIADLVTHGPTKYRGAQAIRKAFREAVPSALIQCPQQFIDNERIQHLPQRRGLAGAAGSGDENQTVIQRLGAGDPGEYPPGKSLCHRFYVCREPAADRLYPSPPPAW